MKLKKGDKVKDKLLNRTGIIEQAFEVSGRMQYWINNNGWKWFSQEVHLEKL